MPSKPIITVFGSSRPGERDEHYEEARRIGSALAKAGFVVCNGGYRGTMEASARGAKEAGGGTIGIVSEFFGTETNPWIDKKIVVKSLVDRLMELVSLADGFVVLKGGTGTLLEFATVWEFMNKSVIDEKPVVVVGKFWNGVIETFNRELVFEGKGLCTRYVSVVSSPEELVVVLKEKVRWK